MNLKDLKNIEIKTQLDKYNINHLYVFGSYARGEQNKNSDLDIMIDYDRDNHKITLFDLVKIEDYFKETFGIKKVDIVTKNSVNKRLKKYIEHDLKIIY